jgi:hypothetical protein
MGNCGLAGEADGWLAAYQYLVPVREGDDALHLTHEIPLCTYVLL